MSRILIHLAALPPLILSVAASAGPPFLTDDPVPTDTGHWEIYGPLIQGDGRGANVDGNVGAELNYGAVAGVQLTLDLPVAYSHSDLGGRWGPGDVAVSAKYSFYHDAAGFSVAVFPGLTLPTASNNLGNRKVTGFLPVWAQKDIGAWSIFGGGGYAINPGAGNRDYWRGGLAVSRQVNERALIGVEVDRQGADMIDGAASTSLGIGEIYQLHAPFRLLASGGPTFFDRGGALGYHFYTALGLNF